MVYVSFLAILYMIYFTLANFQHCDKHKLNISEY